MTEEQQDLFEEFRCKPVIAPGDCEKYNLIVMYRNGSWLLSVRTAEGRREFLSDELQACFNEFYRSGFAVAP